MTISHLQSFFSKPLKRIYNCAASNLKNIVTPLIALSLFIGNVPSAISNEIIAPPKDISQIGREIQEGLESPTQIIFYLSELGALRKADGGGLRLATVGEYVDALPNGDKEPKPLPPEIIKILEWGDRNQPELAKTVRKAVLISQYHGVSFEIENTLANGMLGYFDPDGNRVAIENLTNAYQAISKGLITLKRDKLNLKEIWQEADENERADMVAASQLSTLLEEAMHSAVNQKQILSQKCSNEGQYKYSIRNFLEEALIERWQQEKLKQSMQNGEPFDMASALSLQLRYENKDIIFSRKFSKSTPLDLFGDTTFGLMIHNMRESYHLQALAFQLLCDEKSNQEKQPILFPSPHL